MSEVGSVHDGTLSVMEKDPADIIKDGVQEDHAEADNNEDKKRKRALTVKGKDYHLQNLNKREENIGKRIERQITLVKQLLASGNTDMVNLESSNLDKMFDEATDVNTQLLSFVEEEQVKEQHEGWLEVIDQAVFGVKQDVCKWLMDQESKSSKSQHSSRKHSSHRSSRSSSSRTSVYSLGSRLDQKAKLAALRVEAENLQKTKEAELNAEILRIRQRKESETEAELSKLHCEIAKTEAIEKVLAEEENYDRDDVATRYKSLKLNPTVRLCPARQNADIDSLSNTMMRMVKLQSAPIVDIDVFTGDPLEYKYFKATFKDVVERTVDDQVGRLTRLIKYTSGESKELIKHCIYEEPHCCYNIAIDLLDKEYGNPHRISCAYLKELRNWEHIKQHDATAYKKLHRFLLRGKTYMRGGQLRELDSVDVIRLILSRTHVSIQDRWNREAVNIRCNKYREATFLDLIDFVENLSILASDPAYSRDAFNEAKERRPSDAQMKGLNTRLEGNTKTLKCMICHNEHIVEECPTYLSKDVAGRMQLLFENRLCFACLNEVSDIHYARTCKNKKTCKSCKQLHPTTLHVTKEIKSNPVRNPSEVQGEVISMCVVMVKLSHKDYPENEITVHAMLDSCSQGTFIKDDVLETLNVGKRKTHITIDTMNGPKTDVSYAVDGLVVGCTSQIGIAYSPATIELPTTFSRSRLPVDKDEIATPAKLNRWKYLQRVADEIPHYDQSIPIGLIIGGNCMKALEPQEVIPSHEGGPYASRTLLGWCIVGPILGKPSRNPMKCNLTGMKIAVKDITNNDISEHYLSTTTKVEDMYITNFLTEMYSNEFVEANSEKRAPSNEDLMFLKIMNDNVRKVEGHYELPLPFRSEVSLPNNREQALQRAMSMKKKMIKNPQFREDYVNFIETLVTRGYAVEVKEPGKEPLTGNVWYLPHHGVYHPTKNKIRVVFDGSAKFGGFCLNEELLQGPDMTNLLVGVLLRFRKGKIPLMADIEAMFHQVKVPPMHQDFLRFIWWPNGEIEQKPRDYRMCVHIFGAISSPSCANFALRQAAVDGEKIYGREATNTLLNNFYVDDMLKSTDDNESAISLIVDLQGMCDGGGFNLTKFISNNREVIETITVDKRSQSLKQFEITKTLPIERALGIHWCIEEDTLGFRIVLQDTPLSRRGILSTISSIYDPLGFAGPCLLKGRKILQKITAMNDGWDAAVPEEQRKAWETWRTELPFLEDVAVKRCYKPSTFGEVIDVSLHCFSDASDIGYGQSTYLRQVDAEGNVYVSFVIGKSRVSPLKPITTPRLELTAATTSVKIGALVKEELQIDGLYDIYWTDSKIVLGYVFNDHKRFRVYVANRAQKIRSYTDTLQWKYVETDENPADYASRGLSPIKDVNKIERWLNGPLFLWCSDDTWKKEDSIDHLREDDPELKKVKVNSIKIQDNKSDTNSSTSRKSNIHNNGRRDCNTDNNYNNSNNNNNRDSTVNSHSEYGLLERLETRISSWLKMKRVLGVMLKFIKRCKNDVPYSSNPAGPLLNVSDIEEAELILLKMTQAKYLQNELQKYSKVPAKRLATSSRRKGGNLWKLDPFVDENGILKVGGRLKKSTYSCTIKHPVILPQKSIVTQRIIELHHKQIQHCGSSSTLNEVRSSGYWVIHGSVLVRKVVYSCVRCRLFRGRCGEQKMSELPINRTTSEAPFTFCGVDMFGPFYIKEGRRELKRYVALLTCFSSRAIHLESTTTLETDTFIQALRRFIARRGPVRTLISDNGKNFEGAENEFRKAFQEMDNNKISEFLTGHSCDWITWQKNPPHSSHMGGIWERQIRTVRSILTSLLKNHGTRLNDESLRTLLVEAEAIVNSRPLTVENLNDPLSQPLTPNHLLTMKTKIILPPPGTFQKADVYCRKRWRQVQHLANEFWHHWRKAYLSNLQKRVKWTDVKRNFKVDDIVILKDENVPRNVWPMARVIKVYPDDNDGLVRIVDLNVSNSKSILKRPIHKIVLLVEGQQQE